MDDVNDHGSSHPAISQAMDDQMQSYADAVGTRSEEYNNSSAVVSTRSEPYESGVAVWLKPVTVNGQSQEPKSAEHTLDSVYVLPRMVREPSIQPASVGSGSDLNARLVVSSEQSNPAGYLDTIQQARLYQLELEQHQRQLKEQEENDNNLQIAKQFVNQIRSWTKAGPVLDDHPVNLTQNSCQPTEPSQIVSDSNAVQSMMQQTVQSISLTNSDQPINENAPRSEMGQRGDMLHSISKSVAGKDCVYIPMTVAGESGSYIVKADEKSYLGSLVQERKGDQQKYQMCGILDQEKVLENVMPRAIETLMKMRQEPPQQEKSGQVARDEPTKMEASKGDDVLDQDKKSHTDCDAHDKNKILALLNDTLVQFCHNNLYFVEFVHVTGRVSFNLDNRETIQVALSQMATPRAFTDHTSPAPSDDEDQSTYVKPTRRQTSKCVVARKRGRPRKASARSAPFRKRPVKVESVTSDTNTSMPVRGRKAAARARKRLARIVHVTSDGDDGSSTGIHTTDGDATDEGDVVDDEDYIPNAITGGDDDTSPDGQGTRVHDDGDESGAGVGKAIKKEEPDDDDGDGQPVLKLSMKSESSNLVGSDSSERYRYPCVHCQKRFSNEASLQKHIEAHKVFTCSEPECEQLKFYTRSLIRKHYREVHGRQAKDLHRCIECHREFLTEEQLKLHVHDVPTHICSVCGEQFPDRMGLKRHRDLNHLEKGCHICGKNFISKTAFSRHLKRHKEKAGGKVKCNKCDKEFASHSSLFHHKKAAHSGVKPYQCTECGLTFNFNNSLKLHRLKHSGIRPYKCDICEKSYLTASHLKNHVQALHSSRKQYACPICDKRFPYDNSLKLHMRLHTGDRPFMCAVCSKTFVSKSALKVHEASHVESKDYRCDVCGKTYKTEALMRVHRRRHTADGSRYMCDICGNTYMYKSNLEVHYEVHGEAKKHECKVCGKLFKTYPTLYSHYLVHSDKNPFTCSQCGKAFKTKERLKAHSVRHSGLKPFICDQCGSSFPDKGGLSKHRKTVHAEVARYACPVCGKPCNRADNLRVHMKVHGDPSLLKLSLDELSSARKAGAESSIKSAIQQQQLDSGKSVDTVQAKLCLSPTKLSSGSQQTLHVMEPASSLDIHLPVQHPAAYIHSNSIAVTQQQQQQSSSADQQLPAVNNPQDLTSQVGATPFIGLHHWGTADGAIQYQNLLLSQSYPAASMVQAQVHSLEDANGVVYQATTQQEAGQGTQY